LDTTSHEGMLQLVGNAIDKAIELDDSSRVMLRRMVPLCLGTPADERHEYQVTVGEMLRQALEQAETTVYTAIKDAEDVAAQSTAKVARLKRECRSSSQGLAAEHKTLLSAKQAWCKVHEALRTDWRTLEEAHKERRHLDANLFEALEKKKALEAAIESHFGAIVEGQEIGPNVDALLLAARAASMDTGLVNSFDLVARKRPETRTPFEKVVLNELRQTATTRSTELAGIVESGNPGTTERVVAEEAARAAFSATEERMAEAARHLRRVAMNVQVGEAYVLDAEDAVEAAHYEQRQKAMDPVIAQWSHEQFRHGPLIAFEKLHRRSRPALAEEQMSTACVDPATTSLVEAVATPARAAVATPSSLVEAVA